MSTVPVRTQAIKISTIALSFLRLIACDHRDGQTPNDKRIACIDCDRGYAGKAGMCSRCPAGTEGKLSGKRSNMGDECTKCELTVSRDGEECIKCAPGEEPTLIIGSQECRHCSVVWTDHNNQTYENLTVSHEGLTCETCPAGSEPDATHKGCAPCGGSWRDDVQLHIPTFSDGQSHRCKTCGPGKQVDLPDRHRCEDCATLGIHFHSIQGENCQECEYLRGYRKCLSLHSAHAARRLLVMNRPSLTDCDYRPERCPHRLRDRRQSLPAGRLDSPVQGLGCRRSVLRFPRWSRGCAGGLERKVQVHVPVSTQAIILGSITRRNVLIIFLRDCL